MELNVLNRTVLGKKTKILRRQGLIPAELFGHNLQNKHLTVKEKDFLRVYRTAGENAVINLITDDGKKLPVIISDVQREAISGKILAVDFHQIRMDEKIQVKVPIEFVGESPAVKAGNILIKLLNEIEIETLPHLIPPKFEININSLKEVKQSIHIKDLAFLKEVKVLADKETVIVTIAEKTKAEEMTPTPAAATSESVTKKEEQAPAEPVEKSHNNESKV